MMTDFEGQMRNPARFWNVVPIGQDRYSGGGMIIKAAAAVLGLGYKVREF